MDTHTKINELLAGFVLGELSRQCQVVHRRDYRALRVLAESIQKSQHLLLVPEVECRCWLVE